MPTQEHGLSLFSNDSTIFFKLVKILSVIRLSETMINQIAAGEVIERPASVVKELVENSIDAGASRIDLVSAAGGKNLIRITDDGFGMSAQDLELAVERHCTSKLSQDLLDIRTLGFRGEALPSIGSVARLTISSRQPGSECAWSISVDGGKLSPLKPAALTKGTVVEVSDLFSNTPARLKFLKSDRAETNAITQVFKRVALAFPHIRFTLGGSERSHLDYGPSDQIGRIGQILGVEFEKNALEIDAGREGFRLTGFAALPTFNRGNGQHQFFFVNGRPVRDKSLFGAVRGAYSDFLPRDRHAVVVLFLQCEPAQVDVNVHPAKSDVRFRDGGLVRGLIVGSLKQAFGEAGHRSSSEGGRDMMAAFRPQNTARTNNHWQAELSPYYPLGGATGEPIGSLQTSAGGFGEGQATGSGDFGYSGLHDANDNTPFHPSGEIGATHVGGFAPSGFTSIAEKDDGEEENFEVSRDWHLAHPLGAARAQLHENYIVAQTRDGLMIIDQHAAHERIVYEKLKSAMAHGVAGQLLLIPDIIDLPEEDIERLLEHVGSLAKFGLVVEKFGAGAVVVRETPAMLGEIDASRLIHDLVDELAEWRSNTTLVDQLETCGCNNCLSWLGALRVEFSNQMR